MKNLIGIVVLGIILFSFTNCQKEPSAGFSASKTSVMTDELIQFTNTSTDGDHYYWTFGDGTSSTDMSPTHSYSKAGTYNVTMTAYSKNEKKSTSAKITITVTQETLLKLTVYEYGTTNKVSNCDITLYTSDNDWINMTNSVGEGYTDDNGEIVFKNVQPIVYYIDAFKSVSGGIWDNYGLAYYTTQLEEHKINSFIVYVEFTTTKKARIVRIKNNNNKESLIKN